MNSVEYAYIWQNPEWPRLRYDLATLSTPLAKVRRAQGHLLTHE